MSQRIEHRRTLQLRFTSILAALAALSASPGAFAQTRETFALDRYEPAPAGERFFTVPTADVLGHVDFSAVALAEYARNPLVLYRTSSGGKDQNLGAVVSNQLFLHIGASISFWSRINVSADFPLAVLNTGDSPTAKGANPFTSPSGVSAGDLRAGLRLRLFGEHGTPFQIGLGGYVWFPTGNTDAFAGEGKVRGLPMLLVGGRAGPIEWGASGGVMFRKAADFANTQLGYELVYNAGVAASVLDDRLHVGPEAYGRAVVTGDGAFSKETTSLEIVLGLKYWAGPFVIGAAAGPGITAGVGTPSVRAVLSVGLDLGERDSDGDGIRNRVDACPDVKGVATYRGCPAPDRDKDGILDDVDACPDTPGLASDDKRINGCADRDHDGIFDPLDACPDVAGAPSEDPKKNGCPADRDGDGIPDAKDACPDEPGIASEDPKRNGCPADRDGDGIPDAKDACPDVKGVPSPDPQQNGCPPDTDGDGIRDDKDACPNAKGPPDPDPKRNGCPTVHVTATEIVILEQVQFDTDRATIKRVSDPLLDKVAAIFKENTDISRVEVQGHTDNRGSPAHNKRLSQQRAEAVMKALVKRKIAKGRLVAKGYGPDEPIADNATEEGRQKNRRVQFKILERTTPKK